MLSLPEAAGEGTISSPGPRPDASAPAPVGAAAELPAGPGSDGLSLAGAPAIAVGAANALRAPLFNLSATLDALEARFGRESTHRRYIEVLRREVRRAQDLASELETYGAARSEPSGPAALDGIVAQAVFATRHLARQGRIRVRHLICAGLPSVIVDRPRLLAALQVLLEHAIRQSPLDGEVVVSAALASGEAASWIECQVVDSGPTFRPEDLPRVFEPFFERRRPHTSPLDLAVVERLVLQHGGTVRVANQRGGGVVWTVRLPVAPDQAAAAPQPFP